MLVSTKILNTTLIIKILIISAIVIIILSAVIATVMFQIAICRKSYFNSKKTKKVKKNSSEQNEEPACAKAFREASERLNAEKYEKYQITSYDSLKLSCYYIKHATKDTKCTEKGEKDPKDTKNTEATEAAEITEAFEATQTAAAAKVENNVPDFILIGMHGYRSSAFKEFGIYADFYRKKLNADMLLPDQRAHGESDGKYICYGIKERFDLLKWIEFANKISEQKYGKLLPIYVHGISMGCATVLMSYGLGWPENVKGIIADCGYTSAYAIFRHIIKQRFHMYAFPILTIAGIYAKIRADITFKEISTTTALKNAKGSIPILFIHGGEDSFVPTYMTHENYNAYNGPKNLLIAEKAGHAKSYYENTEEYEAAVQKLIYKSL